MAIVHTIIPTNSYVVLKGLAPDESENDWDRAVLHILWRGTESALRNAFAKGARNYPGEIGVGAEMICAGVTVEMSRFGFIWARVEWIGTLRPLDVLSGGEAITIKGAQVFVRNVVNNATTIEIDLPITSGNVTVFGVGPLAATNPAMRRPRQRVIHPAWSRSYTGLAIIQKNLPPALPKLVGVIRPQELTDDFNSAGPNNWAVFISRTNWFDGINTADQGGGGWLLRNYVAESARVLGNFLLIKWNANFEWMDRHTP